MTLSPGLIDAVETVDASWERIERILNASVQRIAAFDKEQAALMKCLEEVRRGKAE